MPIVASEGDRPPAIQERIEIDVQRTREQQEAQHPPHQCVVELDFGERLAHGCFEEQAGEESVDEERDDRDDQGDQDQTDGVRELEPAVVDPPENSGKGDYECDEVED